MTYGARMVVVEVVTHVTAPAARTFDLALDMEVHAASLAGSEETATTSTGTPALLLGDEVTLRARHAGFMWTMTARVTAYDRPRRFVDEQVRGPFATMSHEHLFAEVSPGRTVMTDRMTVRAPFGLLGRAAEAALLGPYLRRLLRQRATYVRQRAEAG
ncbi:SRPBCC family protein [Georgenia wangjunii]|uniref:SRPBCC family protein n=1 Tax=Georgenia wangjunii TaxID=3117730 RepID=UPI002F26BE32